MKGDKIPDSDNIARFCRPMQAPEEEIQATAFMLRTGEESLSVNWLEFLECSNRDSEIRELQRLYSKKFHVGASARIAILNVGEVCDVVREGSLDNREIEVLHDPIRNDPILCDDESHSEIRNMKEDNELIAELILEVIRENHPAR